VNSEHIKINYNIQTDFVHRRKVNLNTSKSRARSWYLNLILSTSKKSTTSSAEFSLDNACHSTSIMIKVLHYWIYTLYFDPVKSLICITNFHMEPLVYICKLLSLKATYQHHPVCARYWNTNAEHLLLWTI